MPAAGGDALGKRRRVGRGRGGGRGRVAGRRDGAGRAYRRALRRRRGLLGPAPQTVPSPLPGRGDLPQADRPRLALPAADRGRGQARARRRRGRVGGGPRRRGLRARRRERPLASPRRRRASATPARPPERLPDDPARQQPGGGVYRYAFLPLVVLDRLLQSAAAGYRRLLLRGDTATLTRRLLRESGGTIPSSVRTPAFSTTSATDARSARPRRLSPRRRSVAPRAGPPAGCTASTASTSATSRGTTGASRLSRSASSCPRTSSATCTSFSATSFGFSESTTTRNLGRPPLRAETRAELVAGYADDIRQLEQLIGRDLSPWLS